VAAPACTHRHLRDLIEFVDLHWRAHHAAADGRSAVADVPVSLALGAVSIRSLGFVHLCLWLKPQEPGDGVYFTRSLGNPKRKV
jgi:hypothetical protein